MIAARFAGRLGEFSLDVAIDTPASGVTVLFGPSGCGKTTVLRCLAGLTRLSGELKVDGEVWQDGRIFLPPHRRRVGYVFQEASLFAHLSVARNLTYGQRRAEAGGAAEFDRIVALLGLEPLLARGVGKLSGGERQRVAIGRALLSAPALLLMDEPLAGLDGARKAEVLPYLDALCRETRTPVVYVTHDLAEAWRLGDRMLVMRDGRVTDAVDMRREALAGETADLARLSARLSAVGADALRAELVGEGVSPLIARLAVDALLAG
ncbi:MAG: molybdenum transporter ATP-binding protein [Caulobacteraceae bacterium]|nr:molybdenum transporter ATP-binding protein [Caulobacteraceae bacterium]